MSARAKFARAVTRLSARSIKLVPLRSQMAALVAFVKVTFGNTPDVLADFGLKPNKARTPLTISQKAAASAKRAATRAARHTMGPKQKKDIKGTVAPTEPEAASSAPAPVTAAPVASVPASGGSTTAGAVPKPA